MGGVAKEADFFRGDSIEAGRESPTLPDHKHYPNVSSLLSDVGILRFSTLEQGDKRRIYVVAENISIHKILAEHFGRGLLRIGCSGGGQTFERDSKVLLVRPDTILGIMTTQMMFGEETLEAAGLFLVRSALHSDSEGMITLSTALEYSGRGSTLKVDCPVVQTIFDSPQEDYHDVPMQRKSMRVSDNDCEIYHIPMYLETSLANLAENISGEEGIAVCCVLVPHYKNGQDARMLTGASIQQMIATINGKLGEDRLLYSEELTGRGYQELVSAKRRLIIVVPKRIDQISSIESYPYTAIIDFGITTWRTRIPNTPLVGCCFVGTREETHKKLKSLIVKGGYYYNMSVVVGDMGRRIQPTPANIVKIVGLRELFRGEGVPDSAKGWGLGEESLPDHSGVEERFLPLFLSHDPGAVTKGLKLLEMSGYTDILNPSVLMMLLSTDHDMCRDFETLNKRGLFKGLWSSRGYDSWSQVRNLMLALGHIVGIVQGSGEGSARGTIDNLLKGKGVAVGRWINLVRGIINCMHTLSLILGDSQVRNTTIGIQYLDEALTAEPEPFFTAEVIGYDPRNGYRGTAFEGKALYHFPLIPTYSYSRYNHPSVILFQSANVNGRYIRYHHVPDKGRTNDFVPLVFPKITLDMIYTYLPHIAYQLMVGDETGYYYYINKNNYQKTLTVINRARRVIINCQKAHLEEGVCIFFKKTDEEYCLSGEREQPNFAVCNPSSFVTISNASVELMARSQRPKEVYVSHDRSEALINMVKASIDVRDLYMKTIRDGDNTLMVFDSTHSLTMNKIRAIREWIHNRIADNISVHTIGLNTVIKIPDSGLRVPGTTFGCIPCNVTDTIISDQPPIVIHSVLEEIMSKQKQEYLWQLEGSVLSTKNWNIATGEGFKIISGVNAYTTILPADDIEEVRRIPVGTAREIFELLGTKPYDKGIILVHYMGNHCLVTMSKLIPREVVEGCLKGLLPSSILEDSSLNGVDLMNEFLIAIQFKRCPSSEVSCMGICGDEYSSPYYISPCCRQRICYDCFVVASRSVSGTPDCEGPTRVLCPSCTRNMSLDEVKNILPGSVFRELAINMAKRAIANEIRFRRLLHCPKDNCKKPILYQQPDTTEGYYGIFCPNCQCTFCLNCNGYPHDGMECEKMEEIVTAMGTNCVKCPKLNCNRVLVRDGGCWAIYCPCGNKLCGYPGCTFHTDSKLSREQRIGIYDHLSRNHERHIFPDDAGDGDDELLAMQFLENE